ncbi:MAG TPA: GNAT family protein [Rickettsiales bacterium]|nr:GNAT family protein [Rickettsiales bacterium]
MKTFKGSKFILRELDPIKDEKSISENINNPKVLNKINLEFPYTKESYQEFVKKVEDSKNNLSSDKHFIIDINGEAVGSVALMIGRRSKSHVGTFGYWLGEKYWGQGIVPEAVKMLIDYAFNELGLLKLKIDFLDDNLNSRRVAEKNGFNLEYVQKKECFKEGKYKNLICFTRFKKEL